MKGNMSESTDIEQLAAKAFPKTLFHRTKPKITVANKEEEAKMIAKGYTSRYLHQEFPLVVYHAKRRKKEHGSSLVPEQKVVNTIEEEEALGPEWSRERPSVIYTEFEGFDDIGDKHVRYLQSKGFRILDVVGAQTFFSQLNDDMQKEFLDQVEEWDEKELPIESPTPKASKKKKKKVVAEEEEE